jgi:hypothetical protein
LAEGACVVQTLFNSDALWTLAALVPLAVAVASWALQMACGFCSVDPPEFWHAVSTVVIIAVSNAIVRFVLHANGAAYGMAPQYLAPLVVTTTVITISLPTGPFTALTITGVQVALCAMIYYFLIWLQGIVATTVMML